MTKSIQKKKHRKITIIFLAPVLAAIYILGWSLYCAGQIALVQPQKTPTQPDNIEFIPFPEEQTIIH
jgi:hypothetical protein